MLGSPPSPHPLELWSVHVRTYVCNITLKSQWGGSKIAWWLYPHQEKASYRVSRRNFIHIVVISTVCSVVCFSCLLPCWLDITLVTDFFFFFGRGGRLFRWFSSEERYLGKYCAQNSKFGHFLLWSLKRLLFYEHRPTHVLTLRLTYPFLGVNTGAYHTNTCTYANENTHTHTITNYFPYSSLAYVV